MKTGLTITVNDDLGNNFYDFYLQGVWAKRGKLSDEVIDKIFKLIGDYEKENKE